MTYDGMCTDCGGMLDANSFSGKCLGCNVRERAAEEERRDTVECPKCHSATRSWGRKAWKGNGMEYCVGCAKEMERIWMIANACMACGKANQMEAERVFPPERIQQRDAYVAKGVVGKRFVCRGCFEAMTRRKFGVVVRRKAQQSTPILKRISCLLGVNRHG